MQFIKISVCLFCWAVLANEGGEGEGAAVKKTEEKSSSREYTDRTTKLNTLQSRIAESQKEFDRLVEEKAHEKEPKRLNGIIKEMVENSKKQNVDIADYNRVRQELLYQFPAMSEELNRRYKTQDKKEVTVKEGGASLDELLTHAKKTIDKKFAPIDSKSQQSEAQLPQKEESKKLRLEK
jgi:hypothetical protein